MSGAPEEIDWQRLDKTKFLWVGAGLFSGVTTILYPLSVVKTQQMALADVPRGLRGAKETAVGIVRADGIRGLYRGFGTTIFGLVPARGVYLTTLERVKDGVRQACEARGMGPAETAAVASSLGGGVASLATQAVVVPIDVVTQRLMVAGGSSRTRVAKPGGQLDPAALSAAGRRRLNGLQMAQKIVKAEGLIGLYRGFGLSVLTFVPSSALWWGAYGGYQKLVWQQLDRWQAAGTDSRSGFMADAGGLDGSSGGGSDVTQRPTSQVTEGVHGAKRPSFASTFRELMHSDGAWGLWRGVGPRIISSMLWGSAMINTYELLKRICALPEEAAQSS